jgi:hypothetical protein
MPENNYDRMHLISPDPEKTAELYIKLLGAGKCLDWVSRDERCVKIIIWSHTAPGNHSY